MAVKITTKQSETESIELYKTMRGSIAIHVRTPTPNAKTILGEKEARQLRLELDKLIAEAWPPAEVKALRLKSTAYVLTAPPIWTATFTLNSEE